MIFLKIGIKVPIGQERDFGQERVKQPCVSRKGFSLHIMRISESFQGLDIIQAYTTKLNFIDR